VDLFNLEFEKLEKGGEKSRESISGKVIKIQEAIRDTDARASLLGARIGHQDNTAASGEGSESVWDTIRRLCDVMAEVRELAEAGAKAIPEVLERSEGLLDKMSNMSKNLIRLKTFTVESLSVIQQKLASVA
jgi:chromosome segregation ATPase